MAQLDTLVADATLLPKAYWAPWYWAQWLLFTDLSFDTDAMVFVMSTIFLKKVPFVRKKKNKKTLISQRNKLFSDQHM